MQNKMLFDVNTEFKKKKQEQNLTIYNGKPTNDIIFFFVLKFIYFKYYNIFLFLNGNNEKLNVL